MYWLSVGCAFALVHTTLAWGDLGHRTVVEVAYSQLKNSTRDYLNTILDLSPGQDIADFASWPDTIRRQRPWTGPFHYIGSEQQDSPPNQCSISFSRDCSKKDGCIVSAIANYTEIFISSAPALSVSRKEAFYFVMHFLGDIHQPLHAENMFRGGNDLPVLYHGVKTNLHGVWDDQFIRTLTGVKVDPVTGEPLAGEEKVMAKRWAEELYRRYGSGSSYERACTDVKGATGCATSWAAESNALVCSFVMAKGVDWLRGRELGGEYYQGPVPVIEGQIFKAGMRLGAWLEAMVSASETVDAVMELDKELEL